MKKILKVIGVAALGIAAVDWIFQQGAFCGLGVFWGSLSVVGGFEDDQVLYPALRAGGCPFLVGVGVKHGINDMHKKNES